MRKIIFSLISFAPCFLFGDMETTCRRMQAHLLIGDPFSAVAEGKKALKEEPNNQKLLECTLKALASTGSHDEMFAFWENLAKLFPEEAYKRDIVEEICWQILEKGRNAIGVHTQLICLIGAGFTQDRRAIPFLISGMQHSSAPMRSLAVQLSAHYRDQPLREEIGRLFEKETQKEVKIELIKAIGKLRLDQYLPQLIQILSASKSSEEKIAAIVSIIEMKEQLQPQEIALLVKSNRAGLRQLACESVVLCNIKEAIALIIPLISDPNPEVQASALQAIGLVSAHALDEKAQEKIASLTHSADPLVGITASWLLLIRGDQRAKDRLRFWLKHSRQSVRLLAAGAVHASGHYGIELAREYLNGEDPFVNVNLALALIDQREDVEQASNVLFYFLSDHQTRIELKEIGHFSVLCKSTIKHHPVIPHYPEVMNQTVRLKLLNLLAIVEHPAAFDAIKHFLQERQWEVTGITSELLLGEGDESALDLIRDLLKDPDFHIRSEAAIVLATWGKHPDALPTLLEVYPQANRELKIKILETLANLGDQKALPFLIAELKESSQMMRMILATVIIRIIND